MCEKSEMSSTGSLVCTSRLSSGPTITLSEDFRGERQLVVPARRTEGYAAIEDYAVVTDGRTCALSALDGRVDWWAVPTLDGTPVCAALLDCDDGGYLAVAPVGEFDVERHYIEGTNVLECTYRTSSGAIVVTNALNMGMTGRLPWTELAYRIEGVEGSVELAWEFRPGGQLRGEVPVISLEHELPIARTGTQTVAVMFDGPGPIEASETSINSTVTVTEGTKVVLAIIATDGAPLYVPTLTSVDERLDATKDQWRIWSRQLDGDGRWHEAVSRSALVLKTLLAEWTGAIAAAATTSLPEQLNGDKNWDYRFSWVRDSSFAIDALINLKLSEEIHNAVAWLLEAITKNGPDLCVFYTLAGEADRKEETLKVSGYRNSQPVRSGNGAAGQTQLGNFGDVFDTVHRFASEGHLLDVTTQDVMDELAQTCCEMWRKPDSGIWELQDQQHYTISKIGCWVALDRALELVELGQLRDDHADRWRQERDEIRRFIEERCWSQEKKSYTFYAGTDDLDASVLLSARTGFETGERLSSTIDAITRELRHGPLVYRYTGADDFEGAFVACTFWMVQALVTCGRTAEATQLMDEAVLLTNDVGILAEEIDVTTRAFLGNVPQALSHLALINAAYSFR